MSASERLAGTIPDKRQKKPRLDLQRTIGSGQDDGALYLSGLNCKLLRGRARVSVDLHGSGDTGHQPDAIRYLIEVNAYRHALREPDPGEDRIYRGKSRLIRLCVRNVNATSDAADMATNELAVTHQLDGCGVALMNPADTRLLEVPVDPEGIGVDDGDQLLTDRGVIAELRQQIGYISIHRRPNHGPTQIELRLGDGGLVQSDDPL